MIYCSSIAPVELLVKQIRSNLPQNCLCHLFFGHMQTNLNLKYSILHELHQHHFIVEWLLSGLIYLLSF